MEQGDDLFLGIRIQIYEKISATDKINLGEWRVAYNIVDREDDKISGVLSNPE